MKHNILPRKNALIVLLITLILFSLFVSVYLAIKIHNHDGRTISVTQHIENTPFAELKNDWNIYASAIGLTDAQTNENSIYTTYSFTHKTNLLQIHFANSTYKLSTQEVVTIFDTVLSYLTNNKITEGEYLVSLSDTQTIILMNLETQISIQLSNTQ